MRTLSSASVRLPTKLFDGPQPATVLRISGGHLYVALEAAPDLEIGPCAWSHPVAHSHTISGGTTGTYTQTDPAAGTRCLVLFAGAGVTDPWVIGWSGWPA